MKRGETLLPRPRNSTPFENHLWVEFSFSQNWFVLVFFFLFHVTVKVAEELEGKESGDSPAFPSGETGIHGSFSPLSACQSLG